MATAVTQANFRFEVGFTQSNGNALIPATNQQTLLSNVNYTPGTGDVGADRFHAHQYTIPASSTLTLDLDAGTYSTTGGGASGNIVDANNEQITFARLKAGRVEIVAGGTAASTMVTVNGTAGASACVNWTSEIKTGGTYNGVSGFSCPSATGFPVTAVTGDKFVVVNNVAAVATVNVALTGGTA